MKNPLTFRIESSLGAIFISLSSLFFTALLFIAIKNFESDIDVMTATANTIKLSRISEMELVLIKDWIDKNNIELREGQGYRYLVHQYPSKPWLDN